MNQQEEALHAEILSTEVHPTHVRRASEFCGSCPFTTVALKALAEVCRTEYENEDMARILLEAAEKMAAIEAVVL